MRGWAHDGKNDNFERLSSCAQLVSLMLALILRFKITKL